MPLPPTTTTTAGDIKKLVNNSNNDPDYTNSSNKSLKFIKESAEAFIDINRINNNERIRLWFYFIKEVVHHLCDVDRIPIFRGMYHVLNTVTFSSSNVQQDSTTSSSNTTTGRHDGVLLSLRPSILINTRPQHDIDYPLWPEAKDILSQNQPLIDKIVNYLRTAGFVNIQITTESYPCSISLNRWILLIHFSFYFSVELW